MCPLEFKPRWRNNVKTMFVSTQVDFPNLAVDVLYVGPEEAPSPTEPNTLEELDPDLRRKLEKICSRASNFGLEECH